MNTASEFCTCVNDVNDHTLKLSTSQDRFRIVKKTRSSPKLSSSENLTMASSFLKTNKSPNSESWSTYKESWTKFIHKPKMECSVGMIRKPLVVYDPNHERSRLRVTLKVQKARSNNKNTFQNFSMIKNRTIIKNAFQTMYQKSFKHPQILRSLKLKEQMIE